MIKDKLTAFFECFCCLKSNYNKLNGSKAIIKSLLQDNQYAARITIQ